MVDPKGWRRFILNIAYAFSSIFASTLIVGGFYCSTIYMGSLGRHLFLIKTISNFISEFVALYCVFLRHLIIRDFPTFTFTFSGCCEQTRFPKKNGSDMKQRDSDHRKTSCHAFIRGVIDFSTKIWNEVTRRYINGF